jgi:hypothetical protein
MFGKFSPLARERCALLTLVLFGLGPVPAHGAERPSSIVTVGSSSTSGIGATSVASPGRTACTCPMPAASSPGLRFRISS